jgi:flagellar protein FliO/FliZ
LKRIALVLCAVLALGSGAVAGAQGSDAASQPAAGNAVGTARSGDETAYPISDNSAPGKSANNAASYSPLSDFLRMIVVLALVLAAIYGVYRLMKRLAKPQVVDSSAVKILASTSLGPGRALHVIALGSKTYLVGATDASVNLVTEVEDKEFIDALALEAATSPGKAMPGPGKNFGEILTGLLGGRRGSGGRKSGANTRRGAGDFLAGQRERLRKF